MQTISRSAQKSSNTREQAEPCEWWAAALPFKAGCCWLCVSLCLGCGEVKAAWAVLLCYELTGAGDGAALWGSIFYPTALIDLWHESGRQGGAGTCSPQRQNTPISFCGKGLVEPKDIQMISCTLLSNFSHQSLPKFLYQSPTRTWYVPEAVLVGMKSGMMVASSYVDCEW